MVMNTRERSYERSQAVHSYIGDRIATGDWMPGHRVPTERALSVQFEIARNTVRAVLSQLEQEGLIVRHVGRGTFVAEQDSEPEETESFNFGKASPTDIMEVRLQVEPGLGELAVLRATQADFDQLQECIDRGEAARSWREFERWDGEFHEALANATKNLAMIGILQSINEIRGTAVWGELKKKSLTQARRAVYERQHRAILAALKKREPESARKAIRQHLLAVRGNLLGF